MLVLGETCRNIFAVENIIKWVLGPNQRRLLEECVFYLSFLFSYIRKLMYAREASGDIPNAALCGVYAVDLK